jgi:phosphatidyl-myo-inositol alpha-mannosyltransferase
MKIALVAENYFPTLGGIQEHVYHLARQLQARGHDVRVLTGLPSWDGPWRGPPDEPWVVRLGPARRYSIMGSRTSMTLGPGIARKLARVLADEKFDLVHVHAPCDVGVPALLFALYRGPIVGTLHSPMNGAVWPRKLLAPYYQHILARRCRAVISVSETARDAMAPYATFPTTIIPNGVDTAALARGRPLPRFQDGRTNLLMLGRLEPRNGPDIMLAALPRLFAARPDLRLIVAGEGKDGTAAYEALVPPDLRDRVVFLGAVYDERADVYASARLCVVPARSGTFSIIVLEALAAGVPVVATPFVKGHRAERHFAPVKMSPDFSPEALADTVLAALDEDPAPRAAEGKQIAATFDWRVVAAQVEKVYEDVLAKPAHDAAAKSSARDYPGVAWPGSVERDFR